MTYPAWLWTHPVEPKLPVREPNAKARQEIRDARIEADQLRSISNALRVGGQGEESSSPFPWAVNEVQRPISSLSAPKNRLIHRLAVTTVKGMCGRGKRIFAEGGEK